MPNFADLNEEERLLLRQELLRRAAIGYEQSEAWREAAQCWAELGNHQQAAPCFERSGDLEQAARAWLETGHYSRALALYQQWEQHLLEGDTIARVQALLGLAACHLLGAVTQADQSATTFSVSTGQQTYRHARALLSTLTNGDAWAALGDYGELLDRYDLVQEGYERALDYLGERTSAGERVRIAQRYLAATHARPDRLLSQALEERLASWELAQEKGPSQPDMRPFPVESLRVLHTLTGHTQHINSLVICPDGQTLLSGGTDNTIRMWHLPSGKQLHTQAANMVWSFALNPDGQILVSGDRDGTIKLWNLPGVEEVRTLTGHTGGVDGLAFSSNGQTLVSGSHDHTIKVWDLSSGREVRTLTGHTNGVTKLVVSLDGRTLVSASFDQTIKVWDLSSGREVRTLTGHTEAVLGLAMSPGGQTLFSGSSDHTIKVWDFLTGREVRTFTGHTDLVSSLVLSMDGQFLLSGSYDHTIKVWDLPSGAEVRTLTGHTSQIQSLALSPDGQILVSGSGYSDAAIKVWGV